MPFRRITQKNLLRIYVALKTYSALSAFLAGTFFAGASTITI